MNLPKGWSQAKFNNFIKSGLRTLSMKWPPKHNVKKWARVKRGWYLCNGCKQVVPASTYLKDKQGRKKKISNVYIDHIEPIINPHVGFESWDQVIERMFVTEEGLQLLCRECHEKKTKEERNIARERKRKA